MLDTDALSGSPHRIHLDLCGLSDQTMMNMPPRLIDVLEIAAYVYCADQFSRRDTPVMSDLGSDWRRRFRFDLPVRDLPFWNREEVNRALAETLGFLSDDAYTFRFFPAPRRTDHVPHYLDLEWNAAFSAAPDSRPARVILFSGGLDSFAGAVETLITQGGRAILVSHQAAPLIHSRQSELVDILRSHTRSGALMHVGVGINKGPDEAREFTQRARSFLFATLAFVVGRAFGRNEALFYENGVVSLNLPVAQHVIGGRATRTTHPRVLAGFGRLFSLVAEEPFRFANPFFWDTKAEVVERIAAAGLADTIGKTFSCARVREAAQLGGKHCGVCSQCLDRRFGVLAAGLAAHDPAEGYAVDLFTGARAPGVDTTLAESFVLTALKWRDASQATFLSRYGEVYRALLDINGEIGENVARIHDLHRRHGATVGRVLDAALAEHSSLDAMEKLPDSCLLSLVRAPLSPPPLIDAAAERDPQAAVQAASAPPVLERPIRLAIDHDTRQVRFSAGFVLSGRNYDLMAIMAAAFKADQDANLTADAYRYVTWRELAEPFGGDEEPLRKAVGRLRKKIGQQFLSTTGAVIAIDEVVQNSPWKGYRLNPYLVIQPSAVLDAPQDTNTAVEVETDQDKAERAA